MCICTLCKVIMAMAGKICALPRISLKPVLITEIIGLTNVVFRTELSIGESRIQPVQYNVKLKVSMKVKRVKLVYVTYHRMNIDGSRSGGFAIGCPDEETAMACATDIASRVGFRYVRINLTGRFTEGVKRVSFEEYLDGSYLNLK